MKSDLEILENARLNVLSSHEVFPLIGIQQNAYNDFIYHEIFMMGKENEEKTLQILKMQHSRKELEELHEFTHKAKTLQKTLKDRSIDYLEEFSEYRYHPDLDQVFNPKRTITSQDIQLETNYRINLYKCADRFEDFGQQLYTCLINLAMSGELNGINQSFEEGEVFEFRESDFRNLDDQNARLIIKVLDSISDSYSTLVNLNKLDRDLSENDEFPF